MIPEKANTKENYLAKLDQPNIERIEDLMTSL